MRACALCRRWLVLIAGNCRPWCAVLAIEMPVRSPQEGLKALNPAFAYQSYWKALYPKPLNPNPYLSQ